MLPGIFWVVAVGIGIGIVFALGLIRQILRSDAGSPAMQDVNARITEGAWAFIRRQYSTIAIVALVVAAIIGVVLGKLSSQTGINSFSVTALGLGLEDGCWLPCRRLLLLSLGHRGHVDCSQIECTLRRCLSQWSG